MKKLALIFFVILVCFTFCGEVYAESSQKPEVQAMGAVLMDFETGRVLWGKNENTPLPMASTTKIMTAVVTLENANLSDTVKVSRRASAAPEVKMFLTAGEEIKLEYLLHALMLQSSNDAAVAIAEHVGGSVEDFCKMMTEKAADLGAKNTVFVTPNGLDAGDHHSTAYDMALITRYALGNEEFVKIINTPYLSCQSSMRSYDITNKNRLLHEYEGANGVKTGFTGKAGHCFVGAAKRGDMQLISVVLASGWGNRGKEQKWKDTKEVLNYGFGNYAMTELVADGAEAGKLSVERSKTDEVDLYFAESFRVPLTREEKDAVELRLNAPELVRAPVRKDDTVGVVEVCLGSEVLKKIPLLAMQGAERHDLKTSLEKSLNAWLELGTNQKVNMELPDF